nr:NPCBM/NEW2 domain-containing protein [uncultured Emticicia sp.]
MKNKYIFCFVLLCLQYETIAQGGLRITWPLDRTVFQRDANGGTDVWFAGEFGYQQLANGGSGVQYYVYPVDKQTGVRSATAIVFSGQVYVNVSNALSSPHGNIKTFFGKLGRLNTGWYDLEVSVTKNIVCGFASNRSAKRYVRFGVGDVFITSGQSNSSGYTFNDDAGSIPHHTTNLDIPDAVNFLNGSFLSFRNIQNKPDNEKIQMPRALPINANNNSKEFRHKFYALEVTPTIETPATHPDQNEVNIYPNGQSSWTWAPMAYKMYQNGNQVPMMFFNAAWPGSSSYRWNPEVNGNINNPHWIYGQFRDVLLMYGHIFGVKRILWQQGEDDRSTSQADYESRIGKTISQSRNDLGHTSLSWSIAKSTYDGRFNPNILGDIQQAQQNLANANKLGASTDDITNWDNNNGRGTGMKVHFSGAAHNTVGERWANTFGNNTDGTPFTGGQELQQLTITDNGSTFRLNAPTNFQRYYWVKNENGLYNAENTNANHTQSYIDVPKGSNTVDYYTCYMSNDIDDDATNGYKMRMFVSQSFVVPNAIDAGQTLDLVDTYSWNAPKVYSTKIGKVSSKNVDWVSTISQNAQSWLSTTLGCGFDGLTEFTIVAQENTGTSTRYGTITITGSNGEIETIPVEQSATTGCQNTPLTNLSPTNPSGEWQGYGTMRNNLNVSGQTLMVGGYQTNNGIGTHANSRLVYNLNGQYSTFSGSVGRDDAADNCGCGTMKLQFIIKADGATLFTSNLLGTADGKQAFSVNVAGKNNIELIVNDGGDQPWGDHADWLDAILYCGTPPTCTTAPPVPTNVNSSPQTISSGGNSTLSATCATGVVVWNTGQTANSITVSPTTTTSYNAKCVSGSCPVSNTVSVGVTVNSSGCSGFANGTVMGTWTVTGQPLVARFFHGQYWLTQRAGTNPDVFVVRGSGMLQRSDVSLSNGSYYNMVNCFAWTYSDYGSLQNPPSTTFPTPSGYSLSYSQDGTMIYTANSGGGSGSGCTDTYVTNNWASATIGDGSGPKIGQNYQGGTMNINGTTYSQGIGTHAGSEIVYNLGSHSYANFKASVGRDISSYNCNCGGQTIVFKVYNHSTGALIGSSTNNPVTKTINQSASDMVVPISGVSSIRLVVEDGGDQIWGDWANWGKARFTCAGSNFREAPTPTEEWFWVSPNPNDGKFIAKVNLKIPQSVQLYLSDIKGNIIKEYSFVGVEGMNNFEINIQDKITIESIYNIRCQAAEVSDSKRVIVEK